MCPWKIQQLDLNAQYDQIKAEIKEAIERVLDSQNFILGEEVEKFEEEIAHFVSSKYAIGVSSGTDALLISLMAIGIMPGDEVITSAFSFIASAGVIARLGATPIFVDVDPRTFNIEPKQVEKAITKRTKAIIPVHLFGQMADMMAIMKIANENNLYVIEDATQAIGASQNGRHAGTYGQLGCFSFFPSKNLGGYGDAGLVVSNDPELVQRIRKLRNHGYSKKYFSDFVGGNFRLDAIQAAILRVKLKYLPKWNAQRQNNANLYSACLSEIADGDSVSDFRCSCNLLSSTKCEAAIPKLCLPVIMPGNLHTFHQFVIRTAFRNELMESLSSAGIQTTIYYPLPLHLQPCFESLGYSQGILPQSECTANQVLALPMYPELPAEAIGYICNTTADFLARRI